MKPMYMAKGNHYMSILFNVDNFVVEPMRIVQVYYIQMNKGNLPNGRSHSSLHIVLKLLLHKIEDITKISGLSNRIITNLWRQTPVFKKVGHNLEVMMSFFYKFKSNLTLVPFHLL